MLGVAPGYWTLILLLTVAGLGNAAFHPQALAAARSITRSREGTAISLFMIGGELGRGVWPLVAGWLVMWLGLQGLWLFAIPGAFTLLLLVRTTPEMRPMPPRSVRNAWQRNRGRIIALVGFVGLRQTVSYGVKTFVPILWHAQGGSLIAGASLISVMLVVGILGNFSGGMIADHLGRRPVIIWSSVLSATILALFMFSSGAWLWIALAFLGIAVWATAPVTMLIGQDLFPDNRSLASGVALGAGNTVAAMAIFGLGFIADYYGIAVSMWCIAGMSLLGFPLALMLPERTVQTYRAAGQ